MKTLRGKTLVSRSARLRLTIAVFGLVCGVAFLVGLERGGGHVVDPRAEAAGSASAVRNARLVSGEEGWATSEVGLSWTRDAGEDWETITPPGLSADQIGAVYFANSQEGRVLATGPGGRQGWLSLTLYRTSDGGRSWTSAPLPGERLAATGNTVVSFADAEDGYVVTEEGAAAGPAPRATAMFATHDGGRSWTSLPAPPVSGYISFESASSGWLVGGPEGSGFYRTTDGGRSWQQIQLPHPAGVGTIASYGLPRIESGGAGLLPVTYNTTSGGTTVAVFETLDGGGSWTLLSLVPLKGIMGPGDDPPDTSFLSARALVVHDPGSTTATRVTLPAPTRGPSYVPQGAAAAAQPLAVASAPDGITPFTTAPGEEDAFAVVNRNSCSSKTECTTTNELLLTTDGSRSWSAVTPP
jgi:photosystem II stability/assembly factor-like uncharacterized protein